MLTVAGCVKLTSGVTVESVLGIRASVAGGISIDWVERGDAVVMVVSVVRST